MKISLTFRTLKELDKKLGSDSNLSVDLWQYSNRKPRDIVPLDIGSLETSELEIVRDVMKENEEDDVRKVSRLLNTLKDCAGKKVGDLRVFEKMLGQFLREAGTPWLFSLHSDQRGVAYLPTTLRYHQGEHLRGTRKSEDSVSLTLCYNHKGSLCEHSFTFYTRDLHRTIPEILKSRNLMTPDEDMLEEHAKIMERFKKFSQAHGEQFWCKGNATVTKGDYWWSSQEVSLAPLGKPTKAVLDVEFEKADRYYRRGDSRAKMRSYILEAEHLVPVHPVLPLFSLVHHCTVWVNVVNMKPYKYEENLGDKLVLPKHHTRLVGALVHNLDALRLENESEDKSRTLRAKASSSVIVGMGPPGTGKTLTAEVYAEQIKRPLYEVQGAQIGSIPDDVESNLTDILARSTRLRMPLVINEADVYIRRRGDDAEHNAIVATFLKQLEYHNGLVFLTTNRDDIDDAVLSRAIAVIKYTRPAASERLRLWRIMLAEFNVKLSDIEVRKAVLLFPKIVGRDIQNLILLTNRVCAATGTKFSLEELRYNSTFRNIEALTDEQLEAEIAKRREK